MSKERLSRIDFLRDKLSQMGHPTANRIVWENELEKLLKQSKPIKIRGSIKPLKRNHIAWNRKLLRGYKSDQSGWLPTGYFRSHADYVIPPYLKATWKTFLAGDPVYERCWTNRKAPAVCKHWGSKKSKKQVHSNPEVRAAFRQDVDEFFRLMPCVPYQECRDRFSEEWLDGDFDRAYREAEKERLRVKKEEKERLRVKAIADENARKSESQKQVDAYAEKMRAEQWERVEAGRKAFEAAHPDYVWVEKV